MRSLLRARLSSAPSLPPPHPPLVALHRPRATTRSPPLARRRRRRRRRRRSPSPLRVVRRTWASVSSIEVLILLSFSYLVARRSLCYINLPSQDGRCQHLEL
eukprot:Mycagemm_TRINITY_DN10317_c2_g1::TRINITY_DN10317_c2_g1_i3::g.837::m.837 type:complete len:102 gc:universal TRINITY_DN10317_c2_g1_i3:283-588(+)